MNHALYSINKIAEIIEAKPFISRPDAEIKTLLTDSRKVSDAKEAIFFALKNRRDGHKFISDAFNGGVFNFIISDPDFNLNEFANCNFLLVDDTLKALHDLAAFHRSQFNYPVIGITGSNGKTVVKEWLYQLLAPENNIVRSPKSYNSQIGVPLSVWQMDSEHNLAIFEAGISQSGEMDALERIIKPTIGVFTNIGEAHQEGFSSLEEKIEEKLKLFKDTELFIYSCKYLQGYDKELPGKEKFSCCYRDKADLEVIDDELLENKYLYLRGIAKEKEVQCIIPFTDMASIENAIVCWSAMLAMGYDSKEADQRLEKLIPVGMRLEMKNGQNNCSIIDDSYSLDLSSLSIALDFLKQQNQHPNKTLILSDMPGSGLDQDRLYTQVSEILVNKQVNKLIGVGTGISSHKDKFELESLFFDSTDDLVKNLPTLKLYNENILLKGARSFEFEKISLALVQKMHETVLEINLNALEHNLNYYKKKLNEGVKVMAMVKAFSYGSGSFEIANLLQFNKVDYLAVAYADEGVSLRDAGITMPIMVMNPDVMSFTTMIENDLQPEIYSFRVLKQFVEALNYKNQHHYPIHLKFDTGMHRLGFEPADVEELVKNIKSEDSVRIESIFSHLVASEDEEADVYTSEQVKLFRDIAENIQKQFDYPIIRHLSNTSGVSRIDDAQFDMVRLGIGLYGIDLALNDRSLLQTVTTLKTTISQIRSIKAGERVGYNRKGLMESDGKIAVVKIGYADGYNRKLGNGNGYMLINGSKAKTIGNICMDMCMLDITGIKADEGDEVIVFNDELRIEDIAKQTETIPYEVVTSISQRVKRVYFYE